MAPGRARAGIDIRFEHAEGRSFAADYLEYGGLRVRTPRHRTQAEAIIINTSGGIAGGDRIDIAAKVERGTSATITTPAAERIYKSLGTPSRVRVRIGLAPSSELLWIPHETILYDRSALVRTFDVDMDASSRLLMTEMMVFGRKAMDETVRSGAISDQWRIRRGGELVFAEALRLEGDISNIMTKVVTASSAYATGLLVHVAPDSEIVLERLRGMLEDPEIYSGASAWNGLVCARLAAASSHVLKRAMAAAITAVTGNPMPRAWAS